jgi:hypothetical protein
MIYLIGLFCEKKTLINNDYGRGTVFYASCGIKQTWLPKNHSRSGGYTSNWDEIIRAGY